MHIFPLFFFSKVMNAHEASRKLNIVIMGPPGSGKSTLGSALGDGYVHISTGEVIRDEISRGTDVGKKIQKEMESGNLVSGLVISMLVMQRLLGQNSCADGFIIDGYPRTVGQVNFLRTSGIRIDIVIVLHCKKESLVRRILNRRIDTRTKKIYSLDSLPPDVHPDTLKKRADDQEHLVIKRYEQYKQTEQKILQAFRFLGKIENYCFHDHPQPHLVHIDGEISKNEIVNVCKKQISYYREMLHPDNQRGMGIMMSKL